MGKEFSKFRHRWGGNCQNLGIDGEGIVKILVLGRRNYQNLGMVGVF
jgi:hypothetical protein